MHDSSYLDTATDLAKKAGVIMRKNFTANMKKEWKKDNTPVTETDIVISRMVVDAIMETYPEHSVLSEEENEASAFSPEKEYLWICDPVDGTHNFSHGVPTATFALALTKNGEPQMGVIYDPFLERLFYAEKGQGAHMNGHRIHVSEHATLQHTLIGMSKLNKIRNLYPVMETFNEHGAKIITGLSIHYMTALVAAGEFSACLCGLTDPHDLTAGKIIIEEAGGTVTDLFGNTPERYDRDIEGQVSSNGLLHDELFDIMGRVSPIA